MIELNVARQQVNVAQETIKILLIEDDEADRYTYRRYLEIGGGRYEVHEAFDAQSGLDLIPKVQPDCILLDIKLPDASGYEVIDHLVETASTTCPIIVLSVLSEKVYEEGALSLGAAKFLVKGKTDAVTLHHAIQESLRPRPIS